MDYNLFTKIIDEIAENNLTKTIRLAALGESTLYPRILNAVEYCKKKGLESSIITNGLILTPDLYNRLSTRGLNELYISVHSLSEASFEYRRTKKKVSYSSFIQNIFELVDWHVSHDCPNVLILAFMFSKSEWKESELYDLPAVKEDTKNLHLIIPQITERFKNISQNNNTEFLFDESDFNEIFDNLETFDGRRIKLMKNVAMQLVPLNPQLFNTREKLTGMLGQKFYLQKKAYGTCKMLHSPMILSNGSFIPCCYDGLEELVMGKVDLQTSIMSILRGDNYQKLVEGFSNNTIIHPVCQECMGKLKYANTADDLIYLIKRSPNKIRKFMDKVIYYSRNYTWRELWHKTVKSLSGTKID